MAQRAGGRPRVGWLARMSTLPKLDAREFEACSEEELLDEVRSGREVAFGELWRRNAQAGLRTATIVASDLDPESILAEAYLRTLLLLKKGAGPTSGFRTYIQTSIRNIAATARRTGHVHMNIDDIVDDSPEFVSPDFVDQSAQNAVMRQAIADIPPEWQAVLWYTEVLSMKPQEIAPLLKISPNAVAVLAYRARGGLRKKWLELNFAFESRPAQCQAILTELPQLNAADTRSEDISRVHGHLRDCDPCSIAYSELLAVTKCRALTSAALCSCLIAAGCFNPSVMPAGSTAAASRRRTPRQDNRSVTPGTTKPPALIERLSKLFTSNYVWIPLVGILGAALVATAIAVAQPRVGNSLVDAGHHNHPNDLVLDKAIFSVSPVIFVENEARLHSVVIDLSQADADASGWRPNELSIHVISDDRVTISEIVENPTRPGIYTAGIVSTVAGPRSIRVTIGNLDILSSTGKQLSEVTFD